MEKFDHQKIEKEAQELWSALNLYETDLADTEKDPYYLLFEFPYPSGDLHIGHWYAFALTDIYARYKRMQGKNVLFPMGFDSFGLPAENAAIRNGVNPREWTYANMDRMRAQVRTMGTSVDWSKEVVSSDPEYYRWTQWLFSKLYEHDLAERRLAPVKWCPKDQTVLANEQVVDGKCERCGTEVEEKNLTQWFLKITKYAKRLLEDLNPLPWREDIKDAQRAWIGESEGAKLSFPIKDREELITVFTTRPDTLYGATYVVLAPEHSLVETFLASVENSEELSAYVAGVKKKSERERLENKVKTGVELKGVTAINPATKEEIPVYVADYVLATYGTGAVMAVPAHDERDYEFARAFGLPMKQVVTPYYVAGPGHKDEVNPDAEDVHRNLVYVFIKHWEKDEYLFLKHRIYDYWNTPVTGGIEEGESLVDAALREAAEETGFKNFRIIGEVENAGVQNHYYHHGKKENRRGYARAVYLELTNGEQDVLSPEEAEQHDLVWLAPEKVEAWLGFENQKHPWRIFRKGGEAYTGDGLLINSGEYDRLPNEEARWQIAESVGGERVTNYRIRDWLVSRQRYWGCPIPVVYDPEGNAHLVPSEHLPWLLPEDVDFTPSGKSPLASSKELQERVTRIFGEGWIPEYDTLDVFVDSSWYFLRYLNPKNNRDFSDQSLMKRWLPVDRYSGGSEHTTVHLLYARFFHKALYDLALVPTPEPFNERFNRGLILGPDGSKMSKSKGNVVNPDEFVKKYGADAVRMYLAFIGPYNESGSYPWNLSGVISMRRFLDRIVMLSARLNDSEADPSVTKSLATAIKKVDTDTERFKFNTAISALMVLVRDMDGYEHLPRASYLELLRLLAPFAPHLAEHLWKKSGGEGSVHQARFPEAGEVPVSATSTVIVQINGKKKGEILVSVDASEEDVTIMAREVPAIARALHEGTFIRAIYVPGRILNLVVDKS